MGESILLGILRSCPKVLQNTLLLPYIGNLSHHIKNKLSKLCKEFENKILTLT